MLYSIVAMDREPEARENLFYVCSFEHCRQFLQIDGVGRSDILKDVFASTSWV